MATIKSYTDVEQSKKLAEILPIESADMWWSRCTITDFGDGVLKVSYAVEPCNISQFRNTKEDIPCWSLAALLNILPNEIITDNRFECHYQIDIRKYNGGNNTTLYQIAYGNNRGLSGSWHDMISTGEKENLVDACVTMIEKLHELKML